MNKNKRGSHVGIMVSFMIFITFVVFFLSVVTTKVEKNKNKEITLEYIEMKILRNTSYPLTSAIVNITQQAGDNACVELKDLFIYLNSTSYGGVVKDYSNNLQSSYIDNEEIQKNLKINRSNSEETFFELSLSPAFERFISNNDLTCTLKINPEGYKFLSIRKDNIYTFESEFERLNQSYSNDYEELKRELFVPEGNEFIFEFEKSNGEVIKPSVNLTTSNIYSDEVPIQYIDKSGNIKSGFLRVKIG
jgi:hypothetical protein